MLPVKRNLTFICEAKFYYFFVLEVNISNCSIIYQFCKMNCNVVIVFVVVCVVVS